MRLRNGNTIEFLGIWEALNNPSFNPVEFDGFKLQAVLNSFTLTPKQWQWIQSTGAIGIISKAGRYGGTYAHKDIAFQSEILRKSLYQKPKLKIIGTPTLHQPELFDQMEDANEH